MICLPLTVQRHKVKRICFVFCCTLCSLILHGRQSMGKGDTSLFGWQVEPRFGVGVKERKVAGNYRYW